MALSPIKMMALGLDPFDAVVPRKQSQANSQLGGLGELFDAATTNDPTKLQYYIKMGVDLDGMDAQQESRPLHVAIWHGNYDATNMLLQAGANPYSIDKMGRKSMHVACMRGHLRVVNLLLQHYNAHRDGGVPVWKVVDDNDTQPLHYAAQANDNDICNLMIDCGADVDVCDWTGKKPIHYAAESPMGDWEVAECLVKRGADVHAVDNAGVQAIHFAATRIDPCCFDFIDYLLGQGCDIDERTADGRTPLFFAACEADVKMVEYLLLKGAEINAKTRIKIPGTMTFLEQTALHYAAIDGAQVAIVKFLLDKGAESGDYLRSGPFCLYMRSMVVDKFELPFLPDSATNTDAGVNNESRTAAMTDEDKENNQQPMQITT